MNLRYENKLWKEGNDYIAGVDEVGRGSWAGPLVAAAIILPPKMKVNYLRDSKKLSPQQRQKIFTILSKSSIAWAVGIVSNEVIDQVGILEANRRAFEKAIDGLKYSPDHVIYDGNRFFKPDFSHEFIVKADDKIASVAAASIVAKVTRDFIMTQLADLYPQYGFEKHKGYGTKTHMDSLSAHGLSEIHRISYKPIEQILLNEI